MERLHRIVEFSAEVSCSGVLDLALPSVVAAANESGAPSVL